MSLLTGLVYYWNLNGNSNTSVGSITPTDTSMTYPAGKINQGGGFNGTSSKISLSATVTLSAASSSISFWFNAVNFTVQRMMFSNSVFSYLRATTSTQFTLSDTAFNLMQTVVSFSTNTWYHIVVTRNSGTTRVYINGTLVNTAAFAGSIEFNMIGGYGSAFFMNGVMDEIAVYNRPIDAAEVTELYNNGNGFAWPFTRVTGNFLQFF